VRLEQWITCFPCFAFLLCVPPGLEGECLRAFTGRGLAAAVAGTLDGTGQLRVCAAGAVATVFDLATESVTNLARPAAAPAGATAPATATSPADSASPAGPAGRTPRVTG
jgi:selenophosphate synthetase-related protein